MRPSLLAVPVCLLLLAGCGTETKIVTTTVEKTVTADPNENDLYANGDEVGAFLKDAWNEDYPDDKISGVSCVPTPAFQNDTTRWECMADASQQGSITIDVKIDQEGGSIQYDQQ